MTEYRFRVLDAETSAFTECLLCAASDEEAREIASHLCQASIWPRVEVTKAGKVVVVLGQ